MLVLVKLCCNLLKNWRNQQTPAVTPQRIARRNPGIKKEKAGTYLFSQVVSNQVSSAQQSLTTVFGMGTGETSASSAPAVLHESLLAFAVFSLHIFSFVRDAPSKLNNNC